MNDRIQALYNKALVPDDCVNIGPDGATLGFRFDINKFAALIVKECADAADMAYEADCTFSGDYVVEHMGFGEEEGAATWRCK